MGQQPSTLLDPTVQSSSPTPFPLTPRIPVRLDYRSNQTIDLVLPIDHTDSASLLPDCLLESSPSQRTPSPALLLDQEPPSSTSLPQIPVRLPMAQKPAAPTPAAASTQPASLVAMAAQKKPAAPAPSPSPVSNTVASTLAPVPGQQKPSPVGAAAAKGLDAEDIDQFLIELPKKFGERSKNFIDNGVTMESAVSLAVTLYTRELSKTGIYDSLDSEADQQRITESRDVIYKQIVDAGSQIIKSIANAHEAQRTKTFYAAAVAAAPVSPSPSYHGGAPSHTDSQTNNALFDMFGSSSTHTTAGDNGYGASLGHAAQNYTGNHTTQQQQQQDYEDPSSDGEG